MMPMRKQVIDSDEETPPPLPPRTAFSLFPKNVLDSLENSGNNNSAKNSNIEFCRSKSDIFVNQDGNKNSARNNNIEFYRSHSDNFVNQDGNKNGARNSNIEFCRSNSDIFVNQDGNKNSARNSNIEFCRSNSDIFVKQHDFPPPVPPKSKYPQYGNLSAMNPCYSGQASSLPSPLERGVFTFPQDNNPFSLFQLKKSTSFNPFESENQLKSNAMNYRFESQSTSQRFDYPPRNCPETSINFLSKKNNSDLIDLKMFGADDKTEQGDNNDGDILNLFDPLSSMESVKSKDKVEADFLNVGAFMEATTPQTENKNPWLLHGDAFGIVDPFDVEVLQKASEILKTSDNSKVVDQESKEENNLLNESLNRSRNFQNTLKYRKRINSIYDSIDNSQECERFDAECLSLCESIKEIRSKHLCTSAYNTGIVMSPIIDNSHFEEAGTNSIKLAINFSGKKVATFTCDVTTSVEHVISHVVCGLNDSVDISLNNYVLKVKNLAEYLSSDKRLNQYEYIHQCIKYNKDVEFDLIEIKFLKRNLARTESDDIDDLGGLRPSKIFHSDNSSELPIDKESFVILLETFDKEVEKMRAHALMVNVTEPLVIKGVIQAVKAICTILSNIETSLITESVESLRLVAEFFSRPDFDTEELLLSLPFTEIDVAQDLPSNPNMKMEILQCALERINGAVWDLLEMYCKIFRVDFSVLSSKSSQDETPSEVFDREIASLSESVLIHVSTVHRIPPNWSMKFDQFQVICTLYHGDRAFSSSVATMPISISKSFYPRLHFDEWLNFENSLMCLLPRETRAVFKLYGIKYENGDAKNSESCEKILTVIGWNSVHLFNHQGHLVQGSVLSGLWPSSVKDVTGSSVSNTEDRHAPLLQINFPEFSFSVIFPPVLKIDQERQAKDFDSLDIVTQSKLMEILEKDILTPCSQEDEELLWEKRYFLCDIPHALSRVLLCAHSWDWACLSDIYNMLDEWKPLQPINALQLLLPSFPDVKVRSKAIDWLQKLCSDELCDYLPQLVQSLKFDNWMNSAMLEFLIERSLANVRVAHYLYWLLKQCNNDPKYGKRMNLVLKLLISTCGKAMRDQFNSQEDLMDTLSGVAQRLKSTKETLRLQSLFRELESIHYHLNDMPTSLPINPSLEVNGIEIKSSCYFSSNTLPIKLNFKSVDGGSNEAIFKIGDDLRQDSLTLQMIHIMDKLWLRAGLDLRIVTFQCIATDLKKGMIEMVTDSETLRKIHTEYGVTGSFKDHPISEWLQKNNPSELEYQQAVENFTHSCAGYSVATYILGICDRHNDNIMLKTSGHLFHIDFGKFLGDAQMIGNIKRDRVPFVLTSDMVYAINGGYKPTSKFQGFVDLCCQAYNIIRHHGNLFLNLFSLMASAGIPGVSMNAVKYVQNALLPGKSDAEATAYFVRLIEDSVKSKSTQINFFIHNLAQLRFSGDHNDSALLSFVPKTYTMETEGRILSAEFYGIQKRYDQEKYYVYIIKVQHEKQSEPSYLSRSYREFCEFDQKLHLTFPLAKYVSLPRDIHIGRSNIRQVAEKRKILINQMLKSLFKMADEVAHSDIVYTFFHPLLRDQQENAAVGFMNQKELKWKRRESISLGSLHGQIKLSLHYKTNTLYVMIMHAKYLNSIKGVLPDSYVKTYLLPDPNKMTKRKTKIVRKNTHPTYMEMLIYELPRNVIKHCQLKVTVWHSESLQENEFLGGVLLDLGKFDLSKELTSWYPLGII